ncbi:MAG TPA: protein kinase [Thermoanaerobaculia bacterium]
MSLLPGVRLGPYEVLAPLGAGGMGEVYRVRDTRLQREVAIKVLPASFSSDPDRLRRFEREARAASALNHPGILTIHDFGEHDGAPYVVTELLEGETLRERLATGALPARKTVEYGVQIGNGLAAAHEKGIVHRDLKPENLFVTKDGRVKILDFGLAKLTHPETSAGPLTGVATETAGTEPGLVMGTVGYMAPEQVRGLSADARSDIFSLGAVLYEMLTGGRAFRGDTPVETMNAILKEDPPGGSLSTLEISPALARIVWRCLEKSPEERYQSARDLGYALEEAEASASAPPLAVTTAVPRRRPTAWFALLGILAAIGASFLVRSVMTREQRREAAEPIRSLVVLPLENLSRDPEQGFFSDGMTEELIAELGKIRALRVISRTSAMRYRRTTKSVPEIAGELGVDGVVEGSVLRSGGRVRVTAQLIHAATDRHLWSESYERDLKDVLALQSDVAQAIAREIQVAVSPQEKMQLARSRPVDPEAHRLYLLGRYHWNQRTAEGNQKALNDFGQSIAKDPTYAGAYAGLADTYTSLGYYVLPPREAMPKAKAAALKAVDLDDNLAEAHASLANVAMNYDWDWLASERGFRRSIELNPSYASSHQWYSLLLSGLGRLEESLAEAKRALECDPLSLIVNHAVGNQYYFSRRYDEAIDQYRRTLEMDPDFGVTNVELGYAYAAKGMFREAIALGEKYSAIPTSNFRAQAALAYFQARSGNRDEALRLLGELEALSRRRYVRPYAFHLIYLGLGEKDEAFAYLEKAYEQRLAFPLFLKPDPIYDPIRSDPRFADLLRRLGLPP